MQEWLLTLLHYCFVAFIIIGFFELNSYVGLIVTGVIGIAHVAWYASTKELN